MPADERGRPQGRHNGGRMETNQGQREPLQQAVHRVQEGAEAAGHRIREGFDSAREVVGRGYERAEGVISDNPTQSLMIVFGLGFGLGLLLTVALTGREETWYERHVPDSLRDLPDRIADRISRNLPRSMAGH
jgi:hypothetical protein